MVVLLLAGTAGCMDSQGPGPSPSDPLLRDVTLALPAWTDRASARYWNDGGNLEIMFRPATFADYRGRLIDGVELRVQKMEVDGPSLVWGLDRCLRPIWYRGPLQTDRHQDMGLAQYADPSKNTWSEGSIGFNPPPAWLAQSGVKGSGRVPDAYPGENHTEDDLLHPRGPRVGRYAVFATPVTTSYVDTFWVDVQAQPPSIQARTFVNATLPGWPSEFVWTYRGHDLHLGRDWRSFDEPWVLGGGDLDGESLGFCGEDPWRPRDDLAMVTVTDRGGALEYGLDLEYHEALEALLEGGVDPGFDAWRNEHPDSFVAGWALNWTGLPDVRSENQTWTFQFTDASPYSTYETRCQTAPPAELLPGIPHPDPGPGVACTESGPICGTLPYVQAWNERPFEIIDPMAGRAVAGSFWGPTTGEWRVCIGDNSFAMKRADVIYRIQDGAFWSLDLADPYPGYGAFPYISPHALEPTV